MTIIGRDKGRVLQYQRRTVPLKAFINNSPSKMTAELDILHNIRSLLQQDC